MRSVAATDAFDFIYFLVYFYSTLFSLKTISVIVDVFHSLILELSFCIFPSSFRYIFGMFYVIQYKKENKASSVSIVPIDNETESQIDICV